MRDDFDIKHKFGYSHHIEMQEIEAELRGEGETDVIRAETGFSAWQRRKVGSATRKRPSFASGAIQGRVRSY